MQRIEINESNEFEFQIVDHVFVRGVGMSLTDACIYVAGRPDLFASVEPESILTVTLHPARGAVAPVTEVAIQRP